LWVDFASLLGGFGRLGFFLPIGACGVGGVFSIRSNTVSRLFRGLGMEHTKRKRRSVSRRLPGGDMRRGLQRHVKLVGEIVWAWSQLHLAFAFVFARLHRGQSWVGQAIWTTLKSESAQREILESALPVSDATAAQTKALIWAIRATGTLSSYRNDIVHGAMGWKLTSKGMIPSFSYFGNPITRLIRYSPREGDDGERLEGPEIHRLMMLLRGDLRSLDEYVSEVGRSVAVEKPLPLPQRPRLQAHRFVQIAQGRTPKKRRPARRNRPKPSRP
jgi:hypothetical protein